MAFFVWQIRLGGHKPLWLENLKSVTLAHLGKYNAQPNYTFQHHDSKTSSTVRDQ